MGFEYMGPLPDPNTPQDYPLSAKTQVGTSGENNPLLLHSNPAGDNHIPALPLANQETYQEPAYSEYVSGNLAEAPSYRPTQSPAQQQQRPVYPYAPQSPSYPYQGAPQQQQRPGYPPMQPGYPYQGAPQPMQPGPGYFPYPAYPAPYPGVQNAPPRYNGQNGYTNGQVPPAYGAYPGYYGYPAYAYPYPWQPPQPKRDGYLLGMSITAFVGSMLVFLAGIVSILFLLLFAALPTLTQRLPAAEGFSATVQFVAFTIAGLVGGSFTFYHSLRSLFLKKPSADFKLPWFWIFFVLYLLMITIAAVMRANGQAVTDKPLTVVMIALTGLLPSLTVVALGMRRIHFPRAARWPTSWRRFAVALVSGATLGIALALIFEFVLTNVLKLQFGLSSVALDNPNQPIPQDPKSLVFMFILVSVIAPLVEEGFKPLAVVIMIGRMRSAGEAFVLGLACGTGFNLIETAGYTSLGYNNWLDVALQRSSSGLLHGFGAAMVSLGWYFLTHPKETKHRFLLPLGCWSYAVLQHAIWNGSFGFQLLPAPIGPFLDTGVVPLGIFSFPSFMLVYITLTVLMLVFFLYVTKKLRVVAVMP